MGGSPEFDKRVLDLFDQVLDTPEEDRMLFLEAECSTDREVLDAVLRYLEAERQQLPDSIGPFLIIDLLGRGAHGVVYKAMHPLYGTVAIKIIGEHSDSREAQSMERQLMQEALKMSRVFHPNIVSILEINRTGNQAFIVMECVDGPSLKSVLREHGDSLTALDTTLVISVLQQLAAALDHAHKQGVVHRDVTPSNILLMSFGSPGNVAVRLTDFGIAKVISSSYSYSFLPAGTPGYMSPQQIRMEPVDGRADQFSLAVVAYEMLTGRKPFDPSDDGLSALADMTRDDPPLSVQTVRSALSPAVDEVLRRGLKKAPNDRFSTCEEFVTALEEGLTSKASRLAHPDVPLLPAESTPNMASIDSGLLGGASGGALVGVAYYLAYPSLLRAALNIAFGLVAGGVFGAVAQFGVPSLGRLARKYPLVPKNTWLHTVLLSVFAGVIVGTLDVNFVGSLGGGPIVSGQLLICAYLLGTLIIGLPAALREYELRLANVLRVIGTSLAVSGVHCALGAAAMLRFQAEFNSGFMSPTASGPGYLAGCSVGAAIGALMGSQLSLTTFVIRNVPGLVPRSVRMDASHARH